MLDIIFLNLFLYSRTINETFHCAMILATAVVGPGLVHLGVNIDTWIRIFACNRLVLSLYSCNSLHAG